MTPNKIKAAIVGASGFTGSEMARLLHQHPDVELIGITSESHTGKPFSTLHPQFLGSIDLPLISAEQVPDLGAEVLFLALPHRVSMDYVARWHELGVKIIDFSGDFRLSSPEVYAEWYGETHRYPAGFGQAVYGLPELYASEIQQADLVANPGCYPTASLLSLAPLVQKDLIEPDSIIIDAKSGLTGAGVKASAGTHFSEVNENFKAYGLGVHRHTIEIEEQLSRQRGKQPLQVQFTPHLLPLDRGILVTAYAKAKAGLDAARLQETVASFYADKPFVHVVPESPGIKTVRGSHFAAVHPFFDQRTGRVIMTCAIDNLLKGAASQALHSMNLMFGLPETRGLEQLPLKP
ncbi:N-acetyl-gamma-glutamyl-phosphate reductase [Nitritalea halalkaliphila LW7]|uniref:N-acetyl-gamma-glutamyl-phosphate reductase n=1 Tax=Nitritalea halalkaliphila LW7 TaxID=1189621 RepID=I5C299_9BACT|nr:N-acetyl-gamma-glutamyl-phosphate reductase [Nitritalea halalkaliphila]EIM75951.1 N-acetyl-gamma-glutamyl-phosphate reductase [Nitritalea halalkaliphila LW7]